MACRLVPVGLCLLTWFSGGAIRAEEPPRPKSVTVYPIVITPAKGIPKSFPQRMAEVVGTMLERAGMEQIELAEAMFTPPETDDANELASAFGQFVAKETLKTEYALFGQIVRTPPIGPTEIRTIVVDKTGKKIFADRADEKTLSGSQIKPKDPMTACLFLVDRLNNIWELTDPDRPDAPQGEMAEVMRKRSGMPTEEEFAAMDKRLSKAKGQIARSKVTVYPVHLWTGWDESCAVKLAEMLTEQGICQAETTDIDPELTIKGDPNEQKILWDAARSFRKFLRGNPPETPYALLVDYGLSPSASDGKQSFTYVHCILCERTGEWVLADYQNSHHDDFQTVAPQSLDDCNRLVVIRLRSRLSE
jgi:hypothetical protein